MSRQSGYWLLATLVLGTMVPTPSFARARKKASPAQVVRSFLRASYNRKDTTHPGDAIQRYCTGPVSAQSGACYSIAAERWSVGRTRFRGKIAEVDADVWIWRWQDCDWSERNYPSRKTRLTFTAVREAGEWRLQAYHPLLSRKEALEARDEPFYLVIAGCFRTKAAAENHLRLHSKVLEEDESGPAVERSHHFANLNSGWFVVVPGGGVASSPAEAESTRKRLASSGVDAYVRRIH
jgi:hypothetical protein